MEQTKKSGNTLETLPTNTQCWNVVQKVDEKRHAFENKKNSKKKSTRGEGFGQREARGSLGQSGPERVQTRTSETPFLKIAFCRFYFSFGSGLFLWSLFLLLSSSMQCLRKRLFTLSACSLRQLLVWSSSSSRSVPGALTKL